MVVVDALSDENKRKFLDRDIFRIQGNIWIERDLQFINNIKGKLDLII